MRWLLVVAVSLAGCGGHPPIPTRGVVEADLGAWKFRRFQNVLDVEVWVDNNKAQAFTASYVTEDAEKSGHIGDKDVVNVFVTKYEKPDGVVRETVKLARRLASEAGYHVDEEKVGGARTLTINGHGESWVMWPAARYVVKVGGRGRTDVPKALVASYVDRYPSQLPGGALEGALPAGPEDKPKPNDNEPYDSTNPRPDLEHYDPSKVKLPPKKDQ
ncbi:MAG TPA: hypothetical protein VGF94_22320 [Kofleriaceae bacterium]|jgi:hypothetical protein